MDTVVKMWVVFLAWLTSFVMMIMVRTVFLWVGWNVFASGVLGLPPIDNLLQAVGFSFLTSVFTNINTGKSK